MKHSFLRVILAIALAACLTGVAAAQTDIEVWITGTASEAGPPPDNWIGYKLIRENLGINLKL